jgi:phosphodiesterase/alkaline phosphatase D-like protein
MMKSLKITAFLLLCFCWGIAQTAATPQTTAPTAGAAAAIPDITHGPVLEYASDHDAVIAWTSKAGSDMDIHYGTSPTSLTLATDATEKPGGTNHRVKLINLQPSTTYYIQMTTSTGQPVGSVFQFQTPAKGGAPTHEVNLGPK